MSCLDTTQLNALKSLPGNSECADCKAFSPTWASLTFGSLICLECSGKHRGLGVDISFVRSLDLDKWTQEQINRMVKSEGNQSLNKFFQDKGCDTSGLKRYISKEAFVYRMIVDAKEKGQVLNCAADVSLSEEYEGVYLRYKSIHDSNNQRKIKKKPEWFPDDASNVCTACGSRFTLIFRRHHCRKCGALVCQRCAPVKNCKPIPDLGFKNPVRHCVNCYKSPLVNWERYN